MHAHDRTLITNLGFNDPDKRDRRHDLAGVYLSQPEVRGRLMERVAVPVIQAKNREIASTVFRGKASWHVESELSPRHEVLIAKGEGQYKQTIGFLDLVLPYVVAEKTDGESSKSAEEMYWEIEGREVDSREAEETMDRLRRAPPPGSCLKDVMSGSHRAGWPRQKWRRRLNWTPSSYVVWHPANLIVEAKVFGVGVGDIVRQIRLYREFFRSDHPKGYGGKPLNQYVVATLFPMTDEELSILRASDIQHVRLGPSFDAWVAEKDREREARSEAGDDGPSLVL